MAVAQRIVQMGCRCAKPSAWSSRSSSRQSRQQSSQADRDLLRLQEEISDALGANVIRSKQEGGKITIEFGDPGPADGNSRTIALSALTGYDIYGKTPSFH